MNYISELIDIADMLDHAGLHKEANELDCLIKQAGEGVDPAALMNMLSADLAQSVSLDTKNLVMHMVKRTIDKLQTEPKKPHQPPVFEPPEYKVHPAVLVENIRTLQDDIKNIQQDIKVTDQKLQRAQNPAEITQLHDQLRRLEIELMAYKKDLERNNFHLSVLRKDYPERYNEYLAIKKKTPDQIQEEYYSGGRIHELPGKSVTIR